MASRTHLPVSQLRRVRWAVRATLMLGVAASVAANVLHAQPDPVAQIIAAWPPLALLLTVELISRVPVHRRALAAVRIAATAVIAAIAAWVSYWHMAGVTARYGESATSAHLMPLCVDGLVVVASISLVELAGHIRTLDTAAPAAPPARRAPAAKTTAAAQSRGNTRAGARAATTDASRPARRAAPRRTAAPAAGTAPAAAAA